MRITQSERESNYRYPIVFFPLSVLLGIVLVWTSLEAVFWLLPVGNAALHTRIYQEYRIRRFEPHSDIRWSTGWDFAYRTTKSANNLGFLSDNDYVRSDDTKLMTVIGDSFVQASQVNNGEAHHGLLHAGLAGSSRVYGLGVAGSPLSNYLVLAEFARNELNPDAMTFVIVANDFDESMCHYFNRGTGMWCFTDDREGVLVPISPPRSRLRELARYSAVLRYVVFNLGVNWRTFFRDLLRQESPERKFVGNVRAGVSQKRLRASRRSVHLFLDRLPEYTELPPEQILFVVGAIRQDLYSGADAGTASFFGQMRQYFVAMAKRRGYEVIQLQSAFADDYREYGEKFGFPTDGHWNKLAHYIVAREIAGSDLFVRSFGNNTDIGIRPKGLIYPTAVKN